MAYSNNSQMSNKQAKAALNKLKTEVASELGVNLKQGYNGDLTSKQAGQIGGEMVKKLVSKAANDMQLIKFVYLLNRVKFYFNSIFCCLFYIFNI